MTIWCYIYTELYRQADIINRDLYISCQFRVEMKNNYPVLLIQESCKNNHNQLFADTLPAGCRWQATVNHLQTVLCFARNWCIFPGHDNAGKSGPSALLLKGTCFVLSMQQPLLKGQYSLLLRELLRYLYHSAVLLAIISLKYHES